LNVLAVFVDAVFDPVLNGFLIVGVSRVVRDDWHDPCGQQVVIPVGRVIGAVTNYAYQFLNGERVTDALAKSSGACSFR